MSEQSAARRHPTNPLFNDNRLKLGTFGTNVSNGCAITTVPEALVTSWPNTLALAEAADALAFEAIVPVARWKGFGGATNFNGTNFETYTWAAGIAQATENAAIFTTSHVPTVHPIMAAKQAVTVDHISNGRFALNIVCGWFAPELEMFGAPLMEHDARYDYAAEWIEIMKRLWTEEEEFDYAGKFLSVAKGFAMPKPIQKPFPPLMNAGTSGKGQQFAAKYADVVFITINLEDPESSKALVESYRRLAREEYGREIQVWCNGYVVHRDTQKEAEDYLHYYVVEKGDDAALETLMSVQRSRLLPRKLEQLKFSFKAGWGGFPLVGTADQIVDRLGKVSALGVNGVLLNWVDYAEGLRRWEREVMPRLEQAGLRRAAPALAAARVPA